MLFGESEGVRSDDGTTRAPGNGARRARGRRTWSVARWAVCAQLGGTHGKADVRSGRIEADETDCACEVSHPDAGRSDGGGVRVQGVRPDIRTLAIPYYFLHSKL
jgi:hypothetical protein